MQIRKDHRDVERWIGQGEGPELDFKLSITSSAKIARTIVAFANNRGGKIVVGVSDFGAVIGIDPEEEMYMIDEACNHHCDPVLIPSYVVHEFAGVSVLEVRIPNSLLKPHKALDTDHSWKVYIRSGDKSMLASKPAEKQIIRDEERSRRIFDSKETALIDYLKKNSFITPKEFSRMLNLSIDRSRRIMITLSQENILLYHRDERGDYFSLK